jgi:hypothetical protein
MSKLSLTDSIPTVQFVTASNGQRLAILDADEWETFIEWLEDIEDWQIIQDALARLRAGPEKSGALPLEEVLDEL